MKENTVLVKDFRKRYGDFVAVDGISFEVHREVIFGLLGPNGAGKTTTLESLHGLRHPSGGSLSIMGVDPVKQPKRLRGLIGFTLAGYPFSWDNKNQRKGHSPYLALLALVPYVLAAIFLAE